MVIVLYTASVRRADAEDRLDFKYMMYQEDNDRIRVLTPALLFEKEFSPTLSLKIEGVYNAISGASPTGAPPVKRGTTTPSAYVTRPYSSYVRDADDDDEHEEEDEHEFEDGVVSRKRILKLAPRTAGLYHALTGATQPTQSPPPTSSPRTTTTQQPSAPAQTAKVLDSDIPLADVEDERYGLNLELTKKFEQHALTGGFSYSSESDYDSIALSLRDAITFNQKNTTVSPGIAITHDSIDVLTRNTTDTKDTLDLFLGFSQVLNPTTLLSVNFTLSKVSGYLDDQYKVVELNGGIVPEHRPDSKDKKIVYLSLLHMFKSVNGTAEIGYRYYDDTFGIRGDTFSFEWYQKFSDWLIVRPSVRYYQQTAADFYGVSFEGSPEFYSADYRVSAMEALGYGIAFIFKPTENWSIDLGVERYEQSGTDGVTEDLVYPKATIFTAGTRIWF